MNMELGQRFIVQRKKPGYRHGTAHKVYDNLFQQDFTADKPNQKWCADFTYLFLKNGEIRCNCTIRDLYDRSVVASITDRNIASSLATRTLQEALDSQQVKAGLILHSNQGSQYTEVFVTGIADEGATYSISESSVDDAEGWGIMYPPPLFSGWLESAPYISINSLFSY